MYTDTTQRNNRNKAICMAKAKTVLNLYGSKLWNATNIWS